jgi:spore germination protein KC
MKSSYSFLFTAAACCFLLTGCWSQRELTDLAIVSSLGFDLNKDSGYTLTVQVINPSNVAGGLQGGGGTEGTPVTIYSSSAENIVDMNRRISSKLSRIRYYAHANSVVVSEELARKEGIGKLMDSLERHEEFRMTATIIIARGVKAADFLKELTPIDKIPSDKVIKNLEFSEKMMGEALRVNLQDVEKDLAAAGKEPLITGLKATGDLEAGMKLQSNQQTVPPAVVGVNGIGLFKNGKLVDWLEGSAAKGTVWILDKINRTIVSINWLGQEEAIAYRVLRQNTKIIPKLKNGRPEITIRVEAEGDIGEVKVPVDLTDHRQLLAMEKAVEQQIKKELTLAVEQAKKNKSDIFGFGEAIHRSYPKEWKKLKKEWHDVHFPDAKVEVDVEAFIRRTGLRNKPLISTKED